MYQIGDRFLVKGKLDVVYIITETMACSAYHGCPHAKACDGVTVHLECPLQKIYYLCISQIIKDELVIPLEERYHV